jgi:hypothetical protein
MFFGYNVGSTIQRTLCSSLHIFYESANSIIDNFITNLCDRENFITIMEGSKKQIRPSNVMVIKQMESPPIFYDGWIGNFSALEKLGYMHLPGIINLYNPTTTSIETIQQYRNMWYVCYDNVSYNLLTEKLGLQKCFQIQPALHDSFVSTKISEQQKEIDLAIIQNQYSQDQIEQFVGLIKSSMPNIKISIMESISNNDYIINILSRSKIVMSLDPISIIEAKYAICFGCIFLSSDSRSIQYPGLVYSVPNIQSVTETCGNVLSNYSQILSKLTLEKNRMFLENNFAKSSDMLYNTILDVVQKATK